jgi:hypothetical protein
MFLYKLYHTKARAKTSASPPIPPSHPLLFHIVQEIVFHHPGHLYLSFLESIALPSAHPGVYSPPRSCVLRSNILAALDPPSEQDLPASPATHAVEKAVSSLLDQSSVSVHRISGTASDLRAAQSRMCGDGARRDDIGTGGGGSKGGWQCGSANGRGKRGQGRSERDEGSEGPVEVEVSMSSC